jgi:hypothetical protein
MRTFVATVALLAGAVTAPAAAQPARCAADVFSVGGAPVTITVCAAAPEGGSVAIAETIRGNAKSFTHATSVDVLPGAVASRTVDDLSLAPLGLAYTLHLTLTYRAGAASIEHALLLPGAIPLK